MKRLLAATTAALMMVALVSSVAVAKAPANNLLKNVAYYTVSSGSTFCRWATPQKSVALTGGGTASQRQSGNGVSLSITGANAYADNGFYVPLGTLGTLAGYTVSATGSFSTNLWFDTNIANDTKSNGDFFTWSGGCLSDNGGDSYGLGASSTATTNSVTVDANSTFFMACTLTDGTGTVINNPTFAQLTAGDCFGISGATQVAVWIGIVAASGGSLSTTITSAQATLTP